MHIKHVSTDTVNEYMYYFTTFVFSITASVFYVLLFVFSIDGDFVPKEGDEVKYKRSSIPPKNEKFCAVHVSIVRPAEGVSHETWEGSISHGTPS